MIRIVRAIVCMLIMSLLVVPVFAEEKTQAELLQEMMMNGDTGENAEDIAEPDFEPVTDVEPYNSEPEPAVVIDDEPIDPNETATIIELVNRIDELDPRQPDINEVDGLMDMYNSLSDMNKLSVTNYDKLEEAQIVANDNYSRDNPTPTPEAGPQVTTTPVRDDPEMIDNATQYLVTIKEPITIISRFNVDENYDGKIDVPTFTLLGPGGYTYLVDNTKLELKADGIDMSCTWVDRDYVQFDIREAAEGQWQFTSSLPCTFEKSYYIGPISVPSPIVTPQADDTTPMPGQSYNRALIIGVVIILGILLMVGVILVMNKVDIISPVMNPIKNIVGSSDKSKGKYKNDDDDYGASLTDEQIMAQIKKEYEEQKAKEEKMQEEARQEQVQEKYEKENEMNDEHMYETRFDYDDEEEELDEEDESDEKENEGKETKKTRQPRFS